jgi:hypothetical protein
MNGVGQNVDKTETIDGCMDAVLGWRFKLMIHCGDAFGSRDKYLHLTTSYEECLAHTLMFH